MVFLFRDSRVTASALTCGALLMGCQNNGTESPENAPGVVDSKKNPDETGAGQNSGGTTQSGTEAGGSGNPSTGGGTLSTGGKNASGGTDADSTGGETSAGSGGASVMSGGTGPVVLPMHAEPMPVEDLPVIEEMPDPLTMNDGTKVTTIEQWRARREEMIRILEDYTYGHMPPPPENVSASTIVEPKNITTRGGLDAEYRMLHISFGPDDELGFELGIFTPLTAPGAGGGESDVALTGHPILINLASSAGENSLGAASVALERGFAVASLPYQQLGEDSPNYLSTGFFSAYPEYDWRDFSAWAWGISRAVDYLVTDPSIDADKIALTGISRLGQAVLLAGAFDARIALSAPVAGGMAFRFSGQEMGGGLGQGITEVVDQNTYWFGPVFPDFRNQTPKLPSDQHWLPALTAPRLFIMSNSLDDPYGRAYAAAQSYLGAVPVYEFLNVEEHLGQHFRPGGHGVTEEDWTAILDFADQYLLNRGGTRAFNVLPPPEQLP